MKTVSGGGLLWAHIVVVLLVFNILNSDASRALFLPQLFLLLLMSLVEPAPLREWGTRYDSLSTSPSPSTASSLSRINPPTTCTSAANSSLLTPVDATPTKPRAQGDRPSHEASVFVGRCSPSSIHAFIDALITPFQVSQPMLTMQN